MGNSAVITPAATDPSPVDIESVPEKKYLLERDASFEPFNYDAVMIWTLLAGLMQQEPPRETFELIQQAGIHLKQDLQRTDPWFLPVRGLLTQLD